MSDVTVDVVVIGGGAAGLAAALQLGRVRRRVAVVDAGEPRNRPAAHSHGFLGHDGAPPLELLGRARAEVAHYGVEVLDDRVVSVQGSLAEGFTVGTAGREQRHARRLLLATGLTDELPGIPGVVEQWGRGVLHCPYCHGWEVRDRRIVVIDTTGLGAHQAMLFRQLSDDIVLVVHDGPGPGQEQRADLEALGVDVVVAPVGSLASDGAGELSGVVLADGRVLDAGAVVVAPRFRPNAAVVGELGLTLEDAPFGLGQAVLTSPTGATSVPGVYAAGNVTDPRQQVLHAAAHGSQTAAALHLDLIEEDVRRARS